MTAHTSTKMLLTPAEAADYLSIGRSTTYRMIRSGELPSISIGRAVRVPVKALDEWVERQQAERGSNRDELPPQAA
jgi:excisionase family DNA binding protein